VPLPSVEKHFINHCFGYCQSDWLCCADWDWLPQMVSEGISANIVDESKVNGFQFLGGLSLAQIWPSDKRKPKLNKQYLPL
jgi:hypothetical protein